MATTSVAQPFCYILDGVLIRVQVADKLKETLDTVPPFIPPRKAQALQVRHLEARLPKTSPLGLLRIPK